MDLKKITKIKVGISGATIAKFIGSMLMYKVVFALTYYIVTKGLDYNSYQQQFTKLPLLPKFLTANLWLLLLSHLTIVALIIHPDFTTKGLISTVLMFFGIGTYLTLVMIFYPVRPCSCLGISPSLGWWHHIAISTLLCGSGLASIFILKKFSAHGSGDAENLN